MRCTRIKICGITRPEDALSAAEAGADAIGLVFHPPAPRAVSIERARQILDVLPPFVTLVGVFVDAGAKTIRHTAQTLCLHQVQLNGEESPADVAELRGLGVIKALRVDPERFGETLRHWREAVDSLALKSLRGIVLETARTDAAGGTGVANDWATAERHHRAGDFNGLPPLIAAGGLTCETVGDVVRALRPWAVDVSSGVETTRGVKSAEKIAAFVQAVREADAL